MDQEERIKGGRKGTRVLTILIISIVLLAVAYFVLNLFVPEADTMVPGQSNAVQGTSELDSASDTN